MSEVEDFLAQTMPGQVEAEKAMHNGDAGPRLATWSHGDPVTLFGAWVSKNGWKEVSGTFPWLAYEHTTASVESLPPQAYTLCVTHVYRREDGDWRVVHRHGDRVPDER